VALLLLAAATVSATTLNFDDQPTAPTGISSVVLSNQYVSQGVLFSLIDASQSFKNNITPFSTPNYASPFFSASSPGSFFFVDPTNTAINEFSNVVSFTLLGLTSTAAHPGNFSGATIEALDLSGNVIPGQTQIISAISVTTPNLLLTFTGEVHAIRFTKTAGTTGVLPFDDLTFGPLAVPEPSTGGLIAVALLVVVWLRKL
jgi:hypothetical protein